MEEFGVTVKESKQVQRDLWEAIKTLGKLYSDLDYTGAHLVRFECDYDDLMKAIAEAFKVALEVKTKHKTYIKLNEVD